jgi:hypothetical protein
MIALLRKVATTDSLERERIYLFQGANSQATFLKSDLAADRTEMPLAPWNSLCFFKLLHGSFVLFPHCQCDQLADVANEFGELSVLKVEFSRRPLGGVFSRQSVASIFANIWIADELGGFVEVAH